MSRDSEGNKLEQDPDEKAEEDEEEDDGIDFESESHVADNIKESSEEEDE